MLPFRLALVWFFTAGAIFGLPDAPFSAEDSLAAVFSNMDRASARFKDLTADLKKLTFMAVIKEENTDTGKIAVRMIKPHDYRVLISFEQPDRKQVVIAGTKVEIYNPVSSVVQDLDLGKTNRAQIETYLLLGFGSNSRDLQSAYSVKYGGPESAAGLKATRIELVPKSKEVGAQVPKFELWIADETGISVQQKMYQPGGDYTLATYTNMKINQNLPESAVKLNLPKGVQREHLQR
jgi:outer membrane lipoprotein-sorting protein